MTRSALTILQINDTHGYLEPHPELVWEGGEPSFPVLGGYARIASLFEAVRHERPNSVLTLDNGDTFHGTFPAVYSKGEALVAPVNALGLDAMTAHWEFAWGPDHFRQLAQKLKHPMLAINCYEKASGKRPFPPSRLLERAGLRIGVIGIAATIIDKSMPPHFSTGLRFTIGDEELPGEIERLRRFEGAELIVVLSHLGFPQDAKLASLVAGIDVLLSGHTHNRLEHPVVVNGALIIQSGCHGSFVGRLDLDIADRKIARFAHRLIPVDESLPSNPTMNALVESVMAPHRAMLSEVVGSTLVGLHRNTILESPMDEFLLAAISKAANANIAFSNGWRYGAPIPPGPITMNDLWNVIPTNPPVSVVDLTGRELVAMIEENLENTYAADPYRQMGGYVKRCRGLTMIAKIENPPGHRIDRLFVEGRLVEPETIYQAAFVTAQGVPAKYGRNRRDLTIRAVEALRSYLSDHSAGADRQPPTIVLS